jgi:hypothetical protein
MVMLEVAGFWAADADLSPKIELKASWEVFMDGALDGGCGLVGGWEMVLEMGWCGDADEDRAMEADR